MDRPPKDLPIVARLKARMRYPSVDCNEGWYLILAEIDSKLSKIAPDYTISQIKEKFGTLRYYAQGFGDVYDEAREIIRVGEEKSAVTCERCGGRGELRTGGWVRTLCDKDEAVYQANRLKARLP